MANSNKAGPVLQWLDHALTCERCNRWVADRYLTPFPPCPPGVQFYGHALAWLSAAREESLQQVEAARRG